MTKRTRTPLSSIGLIFALYILQGMNLGLTGSIPLFLIVYGATWADQGTFNFVFYPFSFKLLWAPLIDAIYIKRFGRRKSWLVPIQLSMAAILLLLSFYIRSFMENIRIILLTIIFSSTVLFTATQDICVDGLAISLFTATNPQWASTSQTIGQTFGRFLGSSFLLTLESANFTNRFIRQPLSLSPQTTGFLSIEYFVRIQSLAFLIVTTSLIFFFREKTDKSKVNGEDENNLSLMETYLSIVKLFKKKCIRHLTFISLLAPVGLVATNYMTYLAIISQGVPRENLALVNIPVTLITLIAPMIIRHTERPLIWFAGSYAMYIITAMPIAIYAYYTPQIISSGYYYPILILLLACNEFIMTLRYAAYVGFFAAISEPRIGGTYMTLLVTLNNLGFAVNSSIALYIADWLPKRYAFLIMTGICTVLGILFLICSFGTLKRLQAIPTEEWYLIPEKPQDFDNSPHKKEPRASSVPDGEKEQFI